MSCRPENSVQLENVGQSLLAQPSADEQGMLEINDEETEATLGGAAINPSWAKHIDRVSKGVGKVMKLFGK